MLPIRTQRFHLVKVIAILIAAALLLSCKTFSLLNQPAPTAQPQTPVAVLEATLVPQIQSPTAAMKATPAPQIQPTIVQSPTQEVSNPKIEVLDRIYNQDFSKQPPDWDLTRYKNSDLEVNYSIHNGAYAWAARAVTNSSVMKIPDPGIFLPEDGFLIEVAAQVQPEVASVASGIMFRFQDFENFYYAKLSAAGEVSLFALQKNKWIELAGPVKSAHWTSGKLNRLAVVDENSHYELRVNDYPVLNFTDDRFLGGKVGLIAELNAGMEETFLFDNFQVMKTGGSAARANEEENTIPAGGGTYIIYEGDLKGVKYTLRLPGSFIYNSAGEWDKFCLDKDPDLCVAVRRQNGNWNDPEEMANEVMAGFSRDVTHFKIDHQQHTTTADGFTAYWVGSTYTQGGVDYESSRLFVLVQHVGFEIMGYGEPEMMKTYQPVIKTMLESFTLAYN